MEVACDTAVKYYDEIAFIIPSSAGYGLRTAVIAVASSDTDFDDSNNAGVTCNVPRMCTILYIDFRNVDCFIRKSEEPN